MATNIKKSVRFTDSVIFEIPPREKKDIHRKCISESIYDTINVSKVFIKNLNENFDGILSIEMRTEIKNKYLNPMVENISTHSDINGLVVHVQGDKVDTDGTIATHQFMYDFLTLFIGSFQYNKNVKFVKDGYVEKKPYVSAHIHLYIGDIIPPSCENCIWINFRTDQVLNPIHYRPGY